MSLMQLTWRKEKVLSTPPILEPRENGPAARPGSLGDLTHSHWAATGFNDSRRCWSGEERLADNSALDPLGHRLLVNASDTSCVLQDHPASTRIHPNIARSVAVLVVDGCPAAILGGVWPIVINSLYGMPALWLSHVREENIKRKPFFAYKNPSPSVSMKMRPIWIGATLKHVAPRLVRSTFRASHGMPVFRSPSSENLGSKASATLAVPVFNRRRTVKAFVPAITSHRPAPAIFRPHSAQNSPHPMPFSGDSRRATTFSAVAFWVVASVRAGYCHAKQERGTFSCAQLAAIALRKVLEPWAAVARRVAKNGQEAKPSSGWDMLWGSHDDSLIVRLVRGRATFVALFGFAHFSRAS